MTQAEWVELSRSVWAWLIGPFWAFMNAPFIAGLVPALVGVLVARRVAEVAQTNKDAGAIRSAEAQVHDMERVQEVLELTAPVEAAVAEAAAEPAPIQRPSNYLPAEVVAALEDAIDRLKTEVNHRIRDLDGRKAKKYQGVPRYDYRPLVLMLARDGALADHEAYELVNLLTVWNAHRLKKDHLPRDKADTILNFRLARRHRRSRRRADDRDGEPPSSEAGSAQ